MQKLFAGLSILIVGGLLAIWALMYLALVGVEKQMEGHQKQMAALKVEASEKAALLENVLKSADTSTLSEDQKKQLGEVVHLVTGMSATVDEFSTLVGAAKTTVQQMRSNISKGPWVDVTLLKVQTAQLEDVNVRMNGVSEQVQSALDQLTQMENIPELSSLIGTSSPNR